MVIKRVCVFCGAASGRDEIFAVEANRLGRILAEQGLELVTGGGGIGLMGAVADGALAAGGRVIGVIPELLVLTEVAHTTLTRQEIVPDMATRKGRIIELSDAFIVLPGGFGTMDELFEIWTGTVLGIHQKPIGILNQNGYYDPLLLMVDQMVEQGFVRAPYRDAVVVATDITALLTALWQYQAPIALPTLLRE